MEAHSADPIARASVCAGPFQKVLWGRYRRSRTPRPGSDRDAPLPGPAARPRMHPNPAPRRKPAPQRPVYVRLAAPKLLDRAHANAGARKNSMDATTQEPTATSIALRLGLALAKSFPADGTVWRLPPGITRESSACFARTPALPMAQMRAAQLPCTRFSSLSM